MAGTSLSLLLLEVTSGCVKESGSVSRGSLSVKSLNLQNVIQSQGLHRTNAAFETKA